jgi:hypothetical protein
MKSTTPNVRVDRGTGMSPRLSYAVPAGVFVLAAALTHGLQARATEPCSSRDAHALGTPLVTIDGVPQTVPPTFKTGTITSFDVDSESVTIVAYDPGAIASRTIDLEPAP